MPFSPTNKNLRDWWYPVMKRVYGNGNADKTDIGVKIGAHFLEGILATSISSSLVSIGVTISLLGIYLQNFIKM